MGEIRDLLKKIKDTKETVHAKMGSVKDRNGRDLTKAEKAGYTHLNEEFQRIARRDKKTFLSDQCKEIEENIRMEKTKISSRKLEISREHIMQ